MKIKNIDGFREELYKNIKSMYFLCCNISEISETYFENEEINMKRCHHLYNALQIKKAYYDFGTGKEVVKAKYYITVYNNEIDIWKPDSTTKSFTWVKTIGINNEPNKTVITAKLAITLHEILKESEV